MEAGVSLTLLPDLEIFFSPIGLICLAVVIGFLQCPVVFHFILFGCLLLEAHKGWGVDLREMGWGERRREVREN